MYYLFEYLFIYYFTSIEHFTSALAASLFWCLTCYFCIHTYRKNAGHTISTTANDSNWLTIRHLLSAKITNAVQNANFWDLMQTTFSKFFIAVLTICVQCSTLIQKDICSWKYSVVGGGIPAYLKKVFLLTMICDSKKRK